MSALELYCKVRSILMTAQTVRAWDLSLSLKLRKAQHISKARYDCGPKTFACLAWLAWVGLRHSCFWLITSTTSGAPLPPTHHPNAKMFIIMWPQIDLCKCSTYLAHDWHCCQIIWPSSSDLIIICCFKTWRVHMSLQGGRVWLKDQDAVWKPAEVKSYLYHKVHHSYQSMQRQNPFFI